MVSGKTWFIFRRHYARGWQRPDEMPLYPNPEALPHSQSLRTG